MVENKDKALARPDILNQARSIMLFGLAFLIPFYFNIQWTTGPMVNALLIIILFLLGKYPAFAACLIPSLAAIAGGFMPAAIFPIVPFIIISNMIYVFVIDKIYGQFKDNDKGYWTGVVFASITKFIFLFMMTNWVAPFFVGQKYLVKIITAFSWPQLATAFLGGVIAWSFLKWLKRI